MQQNLYSVLVAFFISFSGSLPFGNLNLAAMTIAAKETLKKAIWFALGVTLLEIIYLRFTLGAMNWVAQHVTLFYVFQWATVALMLALCIGSIIAVVNKKGEGKNIFIENNTNRFVLGLGMSAINPMQVPFWAGWATWLFSHDALAHTSSAYNFFTLAAGIGTFSALLIFIFIGKKLSLFIQKRQNIVHIVMAALFFVMAALQASKLLGW
ncbi:MAG: LysE family transporter [Mucilaginibacter sp.]